MLSVNLNSRIINEAKPASAVVAATPRTVQHLLDPDWHVAVVEQLETNPHGIAFAVEPEVMGQWAAEVGRPCEPYMYGYTRLGDIAAFETAYNDTVALWAEMLTAKNDELDGYAAETEDYMESLLDEEYWRSGQW